jgi:hypothetical protein
MTNQFKRPKRIAQPKRTAKARKEDIQLVDAIFEKHISRAFEEAWPTLAARNPNGGAIRAAHMMFDALKRRADVYSYMEAP